MHMTLPFLSFDVLRTIVLQSDTSALLPNDVLHLEDRETRQAEETPNECVAPAREDIVVRQTMIRRATDTEEGKRAAKWWATGLPSCRSRSSWRRSISAAVAPSGSEHQPLWRQAGADPAGPVNSNEASRSVSLCRKRKWVSRSRRECTALYAHFDGSIHGTLTYCCCISASVRDLDLQMPTSQVEISTTQLFFSVSITSLIPCIRFCARVQPRAWHNTAEREKRIVTEHSKTIIKHTWNIR